MCLVVTASLTASPSSTPGWPNTKSAKQQVKRCREGRSVLRYCASDIITNCDAGLANKQISEPHGRTQQAVTTRWQHLIKKTKTHEAAIAQHIIEYMHAYIRYITWHYITLHYMYTYQPVPRGHLPAANKPSSINKNIG